MDRQTDGQTELRWHIRAIAYMLSRVKRKTTEPELLTPNLVHICSMAGPRYVRSKGQGHRL